MTELKTLKDFYSINPWNQEQGARNELLNSLRKEVIKWMEEDEDITDVTQAWIKHFFNISEEDLT